MSPFPNSSKALLTFSSLLASPGWQAVEPERFATMNMRFETHEKRADELLENMREALSLPSGSELWDNSCAHQLLISEEHSTPTRCTRLRSAPMSGRFSGRSGAILHRHLEDMGVLVPG
ncbi:hypothetical protein LCGC14_2880510 [marine sediment metagenome]|uniref:Uncharacterized protein n=1 Tax=marine sediment metagenome TaxID=412755 RepID=A0A0F8Y072_9ZZZZ|tara:strand:- start:1163 stop:1519 length:357 start_codon:yes stop_codon:yes gene_type:complete